MQITFPDSAPPLSGDLVALSQLDVEVLDDYMNLLADEEVTRLTASSGEFSKQQIIEWLSTRKGSENRLDWAIFEKRSGDFVGEIVLNEYVVEKKSMNLRIAISSGFFGHGYGSEAVRLVCEYAFEQLGLQELTLSVLEENPRAIRTNEKAGFSITSTFEEDGYLFHGMTLSNVVE